MKVKFDFQNKERKLQLGDVMIVNETPYLIMSCRDGSFTARGFNGSTSATGFHETLEKLHKSLLSHKLIHCSRDVYDLSLEIK